jgi:YVTN family beta-propeller protein
LISVNAAFRYDLYQLPHEEDASMNLRISRLRLAITAFTVSCLLGSVQGFAQNAYITNHTLPGTVSVINTANNKVIATIPVGDGTFGVAVSPDGSRVYVTNNDAETVSVIDTATNTVIATITGAGNSIGVAVSPDGRKVYIANTGIQSVSVIDTATNALETNIAIGLRPGNEVEVFPYSLALTPDGRKLYVGNCTTPGIPACGDAFNGSVTVVNAATNAVITDIIITGAATQPDVVMSPDGSKVYVTNEVSDRVAVIDTATDTVTGSIPVAGSTSAAMSPDGRRIYIPNLSNQVAVVNATTNAVIAAIPVGNGRLFGASVTPDGGNVYVANYGANTVAVINAASNRLMRTIPVGTQPAAFGNFIQPGRKFAGKPGQASCFTVSVAALVQQFGGINGGAAALGFSTVPALQQAIMQYCGG